MRFWSEIKQSVLTALWFIFLTFPILVIRVNPIEKLVIWRWWNLVWVGIGSFVLSFLWRALLRRKERGKPAAFAATVGKTDWVGWVAASPKRYVPVLTLVGLVTVLFPVVMSPYQTNILITALMYVVLGLGLNIVVGLAGLLDLGYVAFYAVGAYSYALLNHHFSLGFRTVLPLAALLAACFGVLLGFPVLRLRGDYLAIVTLGFGEIIRLILENWNEFSFGPSGISGIARPGFFGISMSLNQTIVYLYYLMIGLTLFTIFVVNRLQHSRIGRAWIALREDEIACQAMGVDKTKTKLTAFALGATWAGMVGVFFAAKTTFINPASFTFLESAMILSIVVLGGMGSIVGVIVAAFILILLPEYLRAFSEYRMLIFGMIMVLMMVFRPQGIVATVRKAYQFQRRTS
ncbi:MAG: high-affinity branched-chain amino acid ABC transporter permease LivM [Thermodesulfobacteriota bacterium]